jgi:hypothetical protein
VLSNAFEKSSTLGLLPFRVLNLSLTLTGKYQSLPQQLYPADPPYTSVFRLHLMIG